MQAEELWKLSDSVSCTSFLFSVSVVFIVFQRPLKIQELFIRICIYCIKEYNYVFKILHSCQNYQHAQCSIRVRGSTYIITGFTKYKNTSSYAYC
jgi:hypothetical protein